MKRFLTILLMILASASPVLAEIRVGGVDVSGFQGPASSTDNGIVRFDGTGGRTVQNSTNVVIDDNGNVGIGTTSPIAQLHIGSATAGIMTLLREDTATTANEVLGEVRFDADDSVSTADASAVIRAIATTSHGVNNKGGALLFMTKNTTSNANGSVLERMRIDSTGNIAIGGMSTAESLLEVQGSEGLDAALTLDADDGDDSGDTWSIASKANPNSFDISNEANVRLSIDSSGRVGIGITDPTMPLVVPTTSVTANSGEQLGLRSSRAAIVTGDLIGGISFRSNDTNLTAPGSAAATFSAVAGGNHTASSLQTDFVWHTTASAATTPSETMRLTGAGALSVISLTSTNGATFGGATGAKTVTISSTNNEAGLIVDSDTTAASSTRDAYIKLRTDNTDKWILGMDDSNNDNFIISSGGTLGTNDYFSINSSGNVGVGTNAPVALLEVNGTTKFNGIVNLNGQRLSGDGGTEGIYVDSSGNVGIGTNSAPTDLAIRGVNDADDNAVVTIQTSTNDVGLAGFLLDETNARGVDIYYRAAGNDQFRIDTGSAAFGSKTNSMTFLSDGGYIGVGTTGPMAQLHIANKKTLMMTPTDTPDPSCATAVEGTLYYDDSMSELCICNGTNYIQIDGGGNCT